MLGIRPWSSGAPEESAPGEPQRLAPPARLLPCLEGRCAHAEHAGNAKRQPPKGGWVLREPPPLPRNAYNVGLLANIAEVAWPPSLYGRPVGYRGTKEAIPPLTVGRAGGGAAAAAAARGKGGKGN